MKKQHSRLLMLTMNVNSYINEYIRLYKYLKKNTTTDHNKTLQHNKLYTSLRKRIALVSILVQFCEYQNQTAHCWTLSHAIFILLLPLSLCFIEIDKGLTRETVLFSIIKTVELLYSCSLLNRPTELRGTWKTLFKIS